MPDCTYFEELCSVSLDGELTRMEKRALEEHLAVCPACAAYLEDLKMIRGIWDELKMPLPEELHESIMQGIVDEVGKTTVPTEKNRRRPPVFTMLAAAVACVMLVMSGTVGELVAKFNASSTTSAAGTSAAGAAMEDAGKSADSGIMEAQLIAPQDSPNTGAAQERIVDAPSASANDASEVVLPENLLEKTFAFCYVAKGSGELPALDDASLIEQIGNVSYFRTENNMSKLEKLSEMLEKAGYAATLREDLGVQLDQNASDCLLIVIAE